MSDEPKKNRSGTTRSYAERAAKGRPLVSFTLSFETKEIIQQLADHYNLSRSAVVELAVRELQKKMR
ncbi:MAG TPA: ribbon-helix-helix protein, CopG family [Labilithrix sp.]|jgi:predicted transcriptional regulator|nr:ribbon-helix-helix protein, CopG family [Labilithrix sp.]